MKLTWMAGLGVCAALTFLSGTLLMADARTRSERHGGMQDEQRAQHSSDRQKIAGTVKKTKNVGLRGSDQENLVVQIQTKQGRKKIVDLGNVEHLEDLDIQKGDTITAWGRSVDIGDKRVLMANKLKANGETIEIERQDMPQGDRRMDRSASSKAGDRSHELDRTARSHGSDQDY